MRKINRTLAALIILLGAVGAHAQEDIIIQYPDTLVVDTDHKLTLTFAFHNIHESIPDMDNQLWESILSTMESSITTSGRYEGVRVSYRKVQINGEEQAKIEVIDLKEIADVFWIGKDGMRQQTAERIEFLIVQPKVTVGFSLNAVQELEHIKTIDVESIWKSKKEKSNTKRVLYNGKGSIELDVFRMEEMNYTNPTDFIEFSAGVGVGFYRDRFIPDISYEVSFNFNDRFGKPRTKIGLLYTQHYVLSEQSEGDFDLNLNGFLNLYWSMSRGTNKEYGIGFGYLINQNGGFYKGDTFKMSIYNRRASKTSLTPELVFTNGFKQSFPALRFGLTF